MEFKWIEKYFSGKASGEEKKQTLKFFHEKELRGEKERLLKDWYENYQPEEELNVRSVKILNNIHRHIDKKPDFLIWGKVAAALLILLAAGYLLLRGKLVEEVAEKPVEWVIKQAPEGVKLQFELPDGSFVHLNSGSSLKFSREFNDRNAFLEGEAYFDVVSDPQRPFKVECDEVTTTVLGTSFNIFSHQKEVVVSVATGKVKVDFGGKGPSTVYLKPGEQVALDRDKETTEVSHFNLYKTIAWKEGVILFEESGLADIIDILQKWYGVEIEIVGIEDIRNVKWEYSGEFDNETLENVLAGIGYVKGFRYKISGRKVKLLIDNK